MRRHRRSWTALAGVGLTVLVAGCADSTEIVTFTDEHGRVCTGTVIVDADGIVDGDREVSALDCDYPPEGKSPGTTTYHPLPEH